MKGVDGCKCALCAAVEGGLPELEKVIEPWLVRGAIVENETAAGALEKLAKKLAIVRPEVGPGLEMAASFLRRRVVDLKKELPAEEVTP